MCIIEDSLGGWGWAARKLHHIQSQQGTILMNSDKNWGDEKEYGTQKVKKFQFLTILHSHRLITTVHMQKSFAP